MLRARFPDAQLYVSLQGVNLQGADARPRDLGDVLAEWLRALGWEGGGIPVALHERQKCYRLLPGGKICGVIVPNSEQFEYGL